jgi:hypothetical protein
MDLPRMRSDAAKGLGYRIQVKVCLAPRFGCNNAEVWDSSHEGGVPSIKGTHVFYKLSI